MLVASTCLSSLCTLLLGNVCIQVHIFSAVVWSRIGSNRHSFPVFLQAVRRMEQSSTPLRYQFVVHGTGNVTLPYNQMLDMLKNKSVDMVVADLTITAERMETVSFTVPYMPSSLAMVTPYSYGSAGAVLDFSKPFSRNLWIALSISFVVTGFVFYFLEDKNHDFSTTSKLHSGGKIRAYLTERLASGQLSSPQDGDEHQNTIPSGSLHDAPTGNPPPPGSSFEIHQDKPLLSRSPSHGTHIPSSFNTVHSVANENASAISPRRANFEVEKAHATKDNHIRSNDTQFQQQPVGVPIYDEASRFRRFTNAFWYVLISMLKEAFHEVSQTEVLETFKPAKCSYS
ncbi:hypothetical protein KP509_23G025500 [Ceratopteris richardii]|uniref:Solute-binding protein family 3/N-terminal domain-containing protein n=1 Tax=Ceratopteris richardii TaxID=49495 RepID=A0A8T2S116_CERRI|nr:hypothetical protein KP509_23G025500 [Ceratopteris richardii]